MAVMSTSGKRKGEFKPKFRAGLNSWKGSAKATKNLGTAVSEIRKTYKSDPLEAVEAIVHLMGRFWPAFRDIDSSSGALSGAVKRGSPRREGADCTTSPCNVPKADRSTVATVRHPPGQGDLEVAAPG